MTTRELRDREQAAETLVWRSFTRVHLEASAARLEKEATRLRDRCAEQGLDATEWLDTTIASLQGVRKALKEEGL